jgi:hypothetical protein
VWGYEGAEKVHCGNYLIHAVRRDLLSHIVFVQPKGTHSLPAAYERQDPHRLSFLGHEVRIALEYKESFDWVKNVPRRPDFMFLAHSPNFTPASADVLIPAITKYICPL